jgi:hypothetical protein
MILFKIYLTVILITIYALLISLGAKEDEQFEGFYTVVEIVFLVGFVLTFILSIICIYTLIK